jgi:hypothetical protein
MLPDVNTNDRDKSQERILVLGSRDLELLRRRVVALRSRKDKIRLVSNINTREDRAYSSPASPSQSPGQQQS